MTVAGPHAATGGSVSSSGRLPISRQIEGLHTDMGAPHAAHLVLSARLHDFVRRAGASLEEIEASDRVRQVRVAARRAIVALRLFKPAIPGDESSRLRRRINRVRRAAGPVRDDDVFMGFISGMHKDPAMPRSKGADAAADWLERDREHRAEQLAQSIESEMNGIEKLARRLLASMKLPEGSSRVRPEHHAVTDNGSEEPATLADIVRVPFLDLIRDARTLADARPSEADSLHELRLACKRTRYTLEIAAPCLQEAVREEAYASLVQIQDRLGPVADLSEFVRRLKRLARKQGAKAGDDEAEDAGLADVHGRFGVVLESRITEAAAFIREHGARMLARIEADAASGLAVPTERAVARVSSQRVLTAPFVRMPPAVAPAQDGPHRMAVIDIGTNSVRVEIVEAFPDRTYRVLDDEKETTRLGSGILRSGVLGAESMERTAAAVARMASIAVGYGVRRDWIRAVGTFAVRAGANQPEFLKLVKERSGLDVAVLTPEQEGKLAFLSAERVLDLSGGTSAVVDIGGGSTEIVLSAAGVPEQIYGVPLGAMLLTEEFGGPTLSTQDQFYDMRRRIDEVLRRDVGRLLLRPQAVIGTGGTFGVLASVLAGARGDDGPRLWDRHMGYEATRSDIAHLIERLRRMSPGERAEVAGIPADRADIIVAGFTLVERVLKRLGANSVRVHDRGIRDGVILSMVAEAFPSSHVEPGPMGAVRRLAQKCNYEVAHSEHVTTLALSLYDSLVGTLAGAETNGDVPGWAKPEARRLLEAAALLHDIGYLVSYSAHHKHSYHLIVHDDLGGPGLFSPREVGLIALVARYHRRAEPKRSHAGYGELSKEDRDLVRRLAGILRIADGLDRTHTQSVAGAGLGLEPCDEGLGGDDPRPAERIVVTLEPALAGGDIDTNRWGAEDKRGLFERAFGREVVLRTAHA